jgi:hypothetical protein
MKTLELTISDELFEHLNLHTKRREQFVADAIAEKIEHTRRLQALLTEGYQATFQEDLHITRLFEDADIK